MPRTDASSPSGEMTETLLVLAEHVERFVDAWESATSPPPLPEFLPEDPDFRTWALVELVKVDLEYRWQHRNLPKRLEQYLTEFPDLRAGGVPLDLIYEEFHIRRQCGLKVDPAEYAAAYPAQADEIRRLLGPDDQPEPGGTFRSTALHKERGPRTLESIDVGASVEDFDLLARLGEGAFAKVFLARQRSMQRLVALKVSSDTGTEPQTLAQMDHDHIVRVFDQRKQAGSELRLLFMQYCPGGTLQSVVRLVRESQSAASEDGPACRDGMLLLTAVDRALEKRGDERPLGSTIAEMLRSSTWCEAVCWIGACLARALDYAHSKGVLHRDIKPANVLLSAEGVPKLADFNIAFSSKVAGATPSTYFGGSLGYMSPEQIEACNPAHPREPDSLDGRSDLYALGVVLWELLTGSRPFRDEKTGGPWSRTLDEMIARRRFGPDAEARAALPADCPPGLVRVLERCLACDREERFPDGAALARQLDLCRNRRVQELLHPPEGSRRAKLHRWSVLCIVLAAAVPNMLAGIFNFYYNRAEIIEHLQGSLHAFWRIQAVINSVAYPTGLGLLAWLAHRVARARPGLHLRTPDEATAAARLRRACLNLGHAAALIGVVEWTLAGIAYPLSIRLAMGSLPPHAYVHFFGSLVLCGLVAAAYPFFGGTYFALRVMYPPLLRDDLEAAGDADELRRIARLTWTYLGLAASVPLLGMVGMALMHVQANFALLALSGGSLVGFGFVYRCLRPLLADLDTLSRALDPSGASDARRA